MENTENNHLREASDAYWYEVKCQEAQEKLIAFCHKHSLINMITFAYFILLLIYCLTCDSCDSPAPVPKGKFSLPLKQKKLTGDFPPTPRLTSQMSQTG